MKMFKKLRETHKLVGILIILGQFLVYFQGVLELEVLALWVEVIGQQVLTFIKISRLLGIHY